MGVQKETFRRSDGEAIQVGHAQYERARPVGETAGCIPQSGTRFEQTRVNFRRDRIAQYSTESAANHIGALSLRKMKLIQGPKMKSEAEELEGGHYLGGQPMPAPVV